MSGQYLGEKVTQYNPFLFEYISFSKANITA